MNIKLKKLKIQKRLSEETLCFSADIYVDGKYAAEVTNRGQGGCNDYRFEDRSIEKAVTDYAISQEKDVRFKKHASMALDGFIDDLIVIEQERNQVERWCKTRTVVRFKTDKEGQFTTFNAPYSIDFKNRLIARHGSEIVEFVNERFL